MNNTKQPWKGEIIKHSPKGIRKIRLFLPLIFCCLFIGRCFYLALFTPKSAQKAQRRQNTVVAPFCSRIFAGRKYPSVGCYLSATFPAERLRGSVQVMSRKARQKKLAHSYPRLNCVRCLWFWQRCIFFEVTFAMFNACVKQWLCNNKV